MTLLSTVWLSSVVSAPPPDFSNWRLVETGRFHAPEATQGVAADGRHIFAIGTHSISKYTKGDYQRVGEWSCEPGRPIIHFNAGFIHDGQLLLAHSNYPEVPMTGSVEWFDTDTLQPTASHSFGLANGSVTWVVRHDGAWFVCFGHYGNRAAEPNRDPTWTSLVRFDDQWRRTGGWVFPRELIEHMGGTFTFSGGAFGPGGYLYVTGHDEPELYILQLPRQGSRLEWLGTLAIPAEGQAFAWGVDDPYTFHCIVRSTREVVILRLETGS